MTASNKWFKDLEILQWWLPLLLIIAMAAVIRLIRIDHDLPSNADPDAQIQFIWAQAFRQTGRADVQQGNGYPPGALALLAAEQIFIEAWKGVNLNPSIDYYLTARVVNAWLGIFTVLLSAELSRRIGKSNLAGLATGLIIALVDLTTTQSRRGNPDSPWTFFTVLAIFILYFANHKKSLGLLYLSFAASIASLSFKYQSGVLLALPILFTIINFRDNWKKWSLHLGIFSLSSAALAIWLIWNYEILRIVEHPVSPTKSAFGTNGLLGFQSFGIQWLEFAKALTGSLFLWGLAIAISLGVVALVYQPFKRYLDGGFVLSIGGYLVLFYLVMSLFKPSLLTYWLAAIVPTYIIIFASLFALLNFIRDLIAAKLGMAAKGLAQVGILCLTLGFAIPFTQDKLNHWREMYDTTWSKPYTLNTVAKWFDQNVPEGARSTSEVIKLPFVYIFPPKGFHMSQVWSLFDETIDDYRMNGYEYLIWTSLKSEKLTDKIEDLDTPERKAYFQNATEVLRTTGSNYWGPDVVVYKLPPIQQHPLYLWFSPAISFRGYDLNQETFKPGDQLELTLYWMSAEKVKNNYIVFVHILTSDTNELLVGKDEPPLEGTRPTWRWEGDMQFFRDTHRLKIPEGAKTGEYVIRIGMYDADTTMRVPLIRPTGENIGDSVMLQKIRFEK